MDKKVFLAVDTDQVDKAMAMITPLQAGLAGIKLGLEFFMTNGAGGVVAVMKQFPSLALFLDLKFHDIPNTVEQAVAAVLPLSPKFMTIHASGGPAMITAAKRAITNAGQKTKLLAVTMLTSLDDGDLAQLSVDKKSDDYILSLAALAKQSGADGVVCGGGEAAMLRKTLGQDFILMCPGIRIEVANAADQKRIMTPHDAIAAGADYLVMGRGLRASDNPMATLQQINNRAL
ncbi:MAG: orotidine-5'-phosphate decarboxylase [Hydrotalea sp.]|nr:orotidine-5'-phosphate decarboxylase [Hydrotalea sp.]